MNSFELKIRRQANASRSDLLAGAEAALYRAARLAQRRARESGARTPGRDASEQSGATHVAVSDRNPAAVNSSWVHTTMKRLPHDPVQFDVLDFLDAVGGLHGISIESVEGRNQILDIIKRAALQDSPATRLHGRRAEAMFGYVAAAIGRCSLIKKEDSRPAFAGRLDMRIPDYRLVTSGGQQFLVEVKNCHKRKLDSRVSFKADYLAQLQTYAGLVRAELRLAIYWSTFKIWTLLSPQDLWFDGTIWTTTLRNAMFHNAMAVVGDMHVGTTPPLVCRLLENPDRPPRVKANGCVEFTIRQVEIECAGRRLTESTEKNLAFQLMLFGEWPAAERLLLDDGRLLGVEYVAEPECRTPGQGFEFVGTLSKMASRRFDELTAPGGNIQRLAPNLSDPGTLTPTIPAGYIGEQLPLWLLIQQPYTRSDDRDQSSG